MCDLCNDQHQYIRDRNDSNCLLNWVDYYCSAIKVLRVRYNCEYNAVFGDLNKISVPYNASFERTRAHHSNLYFGASLPALTALAKEKGYELVGTTSTGVNAFYVREDKVLDIKNKLDNVIAFPSRFRESRDKNNILSFVSGHDRLRLIQHLPVYDFDLSSEVLLKDYSNHYSTSFA